MYELRGNKRGLRSVWMFCLSLSVWGIKEESSVTDTCLYWWASLISWSTGRLRPVAVLHVWYTNKDTQLHAVVFLSLWLSDAVFVFLPVNLLNVHRIAETISHFLQCFLISRLMNQGPVCCCSHTEEICLTVFILFYVQIALDMPVGTYFREGTCTFFLLL